MLVVSNVEVSIKNINILQSISFKVSKFSSIIGRNGAGKTTLIRAIMNILPAKTGNIKFNDKVLNNLKTHDMSKLGIGYMPEDRRLVPDLSVKDNIMVPLWSSYQTIMVMDIYFLQIQTQVIEVQYVINILKTF